MFVQNHLKCEYMNKLITLLMNSQFIYYLCLYMFLETLWNRNNVIHMMLLYNLLT